MSRLQSLVTALGRRLGLIEQYPADFERDWLSAMRRSGLTGDAPAARRAPVYIPLTVGSRVRRLPR